MGRLSEYAMTSQHSLMPLLNSVAIGRHVIKKEDRLIAAIMDDTMKVITKIMGEFRVDFHG